MWCVCVRVCVCVAAGVTIGFGSSAYMMVTQVLEGYDTMVPVNITMGCVNVNVTVDVTYKNLTAGERSKVKESLPCLNELHKSSHCILSSSVTLSL